MTQEAKNRVLAELDVHDRYHNAPVRAKINGADLSLIEERDLVLSLGGTMCGCLIPKPIGPAGTCMDCGTEGPFYQAAVKYNEQKKKARVDDHKEIADRYRRTDWHAAFKSSPDDIDWLYEPIFEAGTINALFGKPGVGKSLLTWDFAVSLVREGKRVMVIDDENREQDTVKRLRNFGCTADELDNLVLYSFAGLPPLDTMEGGEHLTALAEVNEPELVVLDTTTRMVEGDENASNTWLQLYRCSLVPLKQRGITTLRIDHPGKDETRGQRGSSAKAGDVDCIFRLSDISNSDQMVLLCEKSRSGNQEKVITMRRCKDPLRHEVIALGDLDILPQVQYLASWFDRHDVPRDAGRPRLRDVLDSTKGSPKEEQASTTLLALVARFRRGQVEDSGLDADGPF